MSAVSVVGKNLCTRYIGRRLKAKVCLDDNLYHNKKTVSSIGNYKHAYEFVSKKVVTSKQLITLGTIFNCFTNCDFIGRCRQW